MDTTIPIDPFGDTSWLDTSFPTLPELAPDMRATIDALEAYVATKVKGKPKSMPKKEDQSTGPSQKISIRLPKPLLELLRKQAALAGMPYQTFIKTMLHDHVSR